MSEQQNQHSSACPTWCLHAGEPSSVHAHVSEDVTVGSHAAAMVVRMVQRAEADEPKVVVGPSVISVEEAERFAHALLRLAHGAHLAEPGFGIVEVLLNQAGVSTGELALASGLDAERLRAQRAGAQLLNVREFDRLALAAAQLLQLARPGPSHLEPRSVRQVGDVEQVEQVEQVAQAEPSKTDDATLYELAGVADLSQLAALSGQPVAPALSGQPVAPALG